jgi:antibiotic biosynthesis monooxygenase (ABM) superfamily enzyme
MAGPSRKRQRLRRTCLRDDIFPGIARRNMKGYRGAELFIHEDGNETEFVILLRFDSMEAVKEFAGMDKESR